MKTIKRADINKQLRLLGQSAVLEEAQTPYMIRFTMLVICLAVFAFIGWVSVSRIKEVAKTVGEIVPSGHIQVVQHLEGGIVESIAVRDEQYVKKGTILIQISGESIRAEYERVSVRLENLRDKRDRLLAYIASTNGGDGQKEIPVSASQQQILEGMLQSYQTENSIIQEQIVQKQQQIRLLEQERLTEQKNLEIAEASFATQQSLYQERLVPEHVYLNALQEKNARSGRIAAIDIEKEKAEKALQEYRLRLRAIGSSAREVALEQVEAIESEIKENRTVLERLSKQSERLSLRSPVDGIVKGLEIHTIGGVIGAGQKLMEIVPLDNELVAEVKIKPVDVGHIKVGDSVNVKITSYDSSRYGSIEGTVLGISATTFIESGDTPFYRGRIRLMKNYVGEDRSKNRILPGMIVNADIITGEKSVLSYLLKPIHLSLRSAFAER